MKKTILLLFFLGFSFICQSQEENKTTSQLLSEYQERKRILINKSLIAKEISDAKAYKFTVTGVESKFEESIIKETNQFKLNELGTLVSSFNKYEIKVSVFLKNNWSVYGKGTTITVGKVPFIICGGNAPIKTSAKFPGIPQPEGVSGEVYANHNIDFSSGLHTIAISAFIFECNNQQSISPTDILLGVQRMNTYFINANIKFVLCNITVLDQNNYPNICDEWNMNSANSSLLSSHHLYDIPNSINIYLPKTLSNSSGNLGGEYGAIAGPYGFVNSSDNFATSETPSHEMGHLFSVKHTHRLDYPLHASTNCGTNEPVSRTKDSDSNGVYDCYETGDSLCDTPADPNGYADCNNSNGCSYIGSTFDQYKQKYAPDYSNIMSYASMGACTKKFTLEQYKRINYNLLKKNSHLIKKVFDLELSINNAEANVVTAELNPTLGNINWRILNTSIPGATPIYGSFNTTNGTSLNFPGVNFLSCNQYEITINYNACGETISETQTINIDQYPDFNIASLSVDNIVFPQRTIYPEFTYNKTIQENIIFKFKLTSLVTGSVIKTENHVFYPPKSPYFLEAKKMQLYNFIPVNTPGGTYKLSMHSYQGDYNCELASTTFDITCRNTTVDFDIVDINGSWNGHISNNNTTFPIEASTMSWQITTPDTSYLPVTVPSNQTSFDFASELGFTWKQCGQYTITLSYLNKCSNQIISKTKKIRYSPTLNPSTNQTSYNLTSSTGTTQTFNTSKIIKSGHTVIIKNSTLNFEGENTIIDIEPGAMLILDNSTIQGMCGSKWGGILVSGDKSTTVNPANQGRLTIRNGSIIKNAKTAIEVVDGGIVHALNSNLINNEIAVHASNRKNAQIEFIKCNFKTDDAILFKKMKYFIQLDNTNALFSGNTFINHQTSITNTKDYGIGIVSYYSNLEVLPYINNSGPINPNNPLANSIPNTFKNLYKGIDHYGNNGSNSSLYIKKNVFDNIAKCISSSKSTGDRITLNEFNIADVISYSGSLGNSKTSGWGVYANSCNNHIIDENIFNGASYSYGIINSHIGHAIQNLPTINSGGSGKLYLNDFNNMLFAIQTQGPNTYTEISCNNFLDNNQYGINIESITKNGNIYNGQLGNQGHCSTGEGAGNSFDLNASFILKCFINRKYRHIKLNGSLPFTYTDAIGLGSACTDPNVTTQTYGGCSVPTNLENPCPSLSTSVTPSKNKAANKKLTSFEIALLNNNLDLAESLLDKNKTENLDIFNAYKEGALLDLKITPLTLHEEEIVFNEINSDVINVYPNPTINGHFNISFKNQNVDDNLRVDIFDIQGKRIFQSSLRNNNKNIDISKHPKGFYILKIHNKKEVINYSKLIYK